MWINVATESNDTAYETFSPNRGPCELLAGYLSLGHRPVGDWMIT
jgi:hypothetical protein